MNTDLLSQRRIVLWCPYVHWHIAPTIASKVLGQMGSSKYQWFQKVIARYRENIFVYCDAHHTSAVHYHGEILGHLSTAARKEVTMAEARRWNELNGFGIKPENFINQPSDIQPNDIIFSFSTYFLDYPITEALKLSDLYQVFSRQDVFKVVHLTHYIFGLSNLAVNLKLFNVQLLCYESNLAKYRFFKRYFPYIRSVALIPFAVQDRFKSVRSFDERLNRCVATGGISHHRLSPALMEFFFEYTSNNFYPLRVFLTENAAAVSDYIQVKTGYYETAMKDAMKSSFSQPAEWRDLVNRPIEQIVKIDAGKKITYYSEDIVATYNQYRFSYVSDEIYHAPALGFFESMACGAIPLGIDDDIYRDIGLVKGVHYLAFDGSFGGLMATLLQAQKEPEAVRHIPGENAKLIKAFSEQRVAELFVEKLTREYQGWSQARSRRMPAPAMRPSRAAEANPAAVLAGAGP
jgi:hypothetical protein